MDENLIQSYDLISSIFSFALHFLFSVSFFWNILHFFLCIQNKILLCSYLSHWVLNRILGMSIQTFDSRQSILIQLSTCMVRPHWGYDGDISKLEKFTIIFYDRSQLIMTVNCHGCDRLWPWSIIKYSCELPKKYISKVHTKKRVVMLFY